MIDTQKPLGDKIAANLKRMAPRLSITNDDDLSAAMKCAADHIDAQAAETDLLRKTLDDISAGIPARDAEIASLREALKLAYGYLWHINNEPGTPNQHDPEKMAYAARKIVRELLTSEERGTGINAARAALSQGEQG